MTEIEKAILSEIQQLAINDPQKLIDKYLDIGKVEACIRRKKGQSYQQISLAMSTAGKKVSKKKVWSDCLTCP